MFRSFLDTNKGEQKAFSNGAWDYTYTPIPRGIYYGQSEITFPPIDIFFLIPFLLLTFLAVIRAYIKQEKESFPLFSSLFSGLGSRSRSEPGVFGSLEPEPEPEPFEKKKRSRSRSRSRLEKKVRSRSR